MSRIYRLGAESAKKRYSLHSFLRGVAVGAVLTVLCIGVAVAQPYRRDLTRLSRSVWGMDAPIANLAAQIEQESAWNPNAVSFAGARGLAQFMPSTASWISGLYGDENAPFDPRWALLYQSRYMKRLFDAVRAIDDCERYAFALSAYNGGLGYVYKRQRLSANPGVCMFGTCQINPGILPSNQRENEEYPRRILLRLTPKYKDWGPSKC